MLLMVVIHVEVRRRMMLLRIVIVLFRGQGRTAMGGWRVAGNASSQMLRLLLRPVFVELVAHIISCIILLYLKMNKIVENTVCILRKSICEETVLPCAVAFVVACVDVVVAVVEVATEL